MQISERLMIIILEIVPRLGPKAARRKVQFAEKVRFRISDKLTLLLIL